MTRSSTLRITHLSPRHRPSLWSIDILCLGQRHSLSRTETLSVSDRASLCLRSPTERLSVSDRDTLCLGQRRSLCLGQRHSLSRTKTKSTKRYLQVLSQVKFEMTMDLYIDEKDKELGRARLSQGGEGASARVPTRYVLHNSSVTYLRII